MIMIISVKMVWNVTKETITSLFRDVVMVVNMITTTAMILTEIASLSFLIPRTLAGLQTTEKNKKV